MRYLIVSLGSIGRRHLANLRMLRPTASIGVLRQTNNGDVGDVLKEANHHFSSLEEAIAFKPDAVIIAGPASTHKDIAYSFAHAGAHLLIEKPFADKPKELDTLITYCKKQCLVLMIGYNFRFLDSLNETRHLINSGIIGSILGVRAEVGQYLPDWRPLRDYRRSVSAQRSLGGGVLLELSHEFDYLYWFFGKPTRITARGGHYSELEMDVEDMVEVVLEYESPFRLINIHLDMIQRAPVRRCSFIGERGSLLWDGITDRIECYRVEKSKWETMNNRVCSDKNQTYIDELDHFLKCTESRDVPIVDGTQGLDVLSIVRAAQVSLEKTTTIEMNRFYEYAT